MITNNLGHALEALIAQAERELVLVAPFVKQHVVERLLAHAAPGVPICIITRWRPEEIAAGVSDIGVWPLLHSREGAELLLHDPLHAKWYRGDESVWVGSANLTGRALGWTHPANLEVLSPGDVSACREIERDLRRRAVRVDDALYRDTRRLVALLPTPVFSPPEHQEPTDAPDAARMAADIPWWPAVTDLDALWEAYCGKQMTEDETSRAQHDFRLLELPPGLSESSFLACVAGRLLHNPWLRRLDSYLAQPRRFGEVRRWLCDQGVSYDDATTAWRVWPRWLSSCFPERYRFWTPVHTMMAQRVPTGSE